jgi:hypothetical protein
MNEELKLEGYWCLPNTPENEIFGQFTFIPGKSLAVNLQGELSAPPDFPRFRPVFSEPSLIIGNETNQGREVTLYKCQQTGAIGFVPQKTSFIAKAAFLGVHFNREEDVKFRSISIRFSNLEKWANKRPIETEFLENNFSKLNIHYESPSTVKAVINDLEVRIVFIGPSVSGVGNNKVSISYETRVEIVFQNEKPFEDCLTIIHRIQNFFGLAMGVPTFPISVRGLSDSNKTEIINGKSFSIPIDIYYSAASWPEALNESYEYNMLFTLPAIEDNFEVYIRNWIDNFDLLAPSINLYFSVLYNPHSFAEVKFLSLAQAIETYHRRVFGGKYQSDKEYQSDIFMRLVAALPKVTDKDFLRSLKNRIHYGNEYSFRTRVREVVESVKEELPFAFVQSSKDRQTFITKVVDTRNYWTHYSTELADKASQSAEERLRLTTSLQLLLEVRFLKELGFDSPTIKNLIQRSDRYKLLKNRGY